MITLVSYKNDRFFFPFELGNEQMKTNYYVFATSQSLLEQWVRTLIKCKAIFLLFLYYNKHVLFIQEDLILRKTFHQ